jgi:hypothetical protein
LFETFGKPLKIVLPGVLRDRVEQLGILVVALK